MQELISIKEKEGIDFITSLKEIYLKAEMSRKHWAKWLYRNVTENKFFKENKDYQTFPHWENGNESLDVTCTLDMAKHLVMQMPTNKAFELRQYLIDYEKNHKKEILPQLTEMQMISKIANSQDLALKRLEVLENKFDTVVTLESGKQRKIQLAVAHKVYSILENEEHKLRYFDNEMASKDYQDDKRFLFNSIYRDIKRKFGVASYKDIKVVEYEKALNFIENWIEDKEVI